ncbi:Mu transposase C-terminal domain-containing protein [Kribbella sancticallisti]|uniref:Mu transposase C-terminal domain-containing protein n=1 Tax=Kribbella sancticallisti TaxID=460087 RepID=UPI003CD09E76
MACYHGQVHDFLGRTPAAAWAELAGAADQGPVTVSNETAFLVDFLPVGRRSLTRTGFLVDHVYYYCHALRPWIARREQLDKFVLRRDPRDISRIWALEPDGTACVQVPYRAQSRPAISMSERCAAVARLREQDRDDVDEQAVFAMVDQMRRITDTAAATTRKARRDQGRRDEAGHQTRSTGTPAPVVEPPTGPDDVDAEAPLSAPAFEVIEQW